MTLKTYQKQFAGFKSPSAGAEVTPEILAKINGYALKPLTSEQVYARKFLMAHNGVDRDRERFPETLLDDFARTFPGKSFLFAHDRRNYLPLGLYFDAATEEISPEQFKALTGEEIKLPDGMASAKVVWAWMYMLKTDSQQNIIENLDAGIYRHVSIGFGAADLTPVKGAFDQTLYWEYKGPGEATEGSLVWLGAQPGATAQKAAKDKSTNNREDSVMKSLIVKIGAAIGKAFGVDAAEDEVAQAVKDALAAKDRKITELENQVVESGALADVGKAHQDELVAEYARMKAALGECEETEEAAKTMKGFARAMGFDFLKAEVKHLQARMEEKFPDGQVKGDDRRDKSNDGGKSDKNPLIPEGE